MSQHESAIPRVLPLELVFTRLDGKSFARARVVCKEWRDITCQLEVRLGRFKNEWGIARVSGFGPSGNILEAATESSFVTSHSVGKYDTLAGLALKYASSTTALRIQNGLVTEWGLNARKTVYVPAKPECLVGATVEVQYNEDACREMLLVHAKVPTSVGSPTNGNDENGLEEMLSDLNIDPGHQQVSRARRLTAKSLANELYIDTDAALFYLQSAGWNFQKAKQQFLADGCFVQGRRL